ncbi:hypothetical protein SAMN00790413_05228 [Deinococcus hopiensis KR-140]|uniref:Uncharacterized protein n=1 Tax=Deinococcus hopiensis KR-140 TaxID=695939 RepID=A0A1W1UUC7_9DEIO|nr:hypothetical protein SAMN00790413_05228 [Deinococcus hopiensis KR-140]
MFKCTGNRDVHFYVTMPQRRSPEGSPINLGKRVGNLYRVTDQLGWEALSPKLSVEGYLPVQNKTLASDETSSIRICNALLDAKVVKVMHRGPSWCRPAPSQRHQLRAATLGKFCPGLPVSASLIPRATRTGSRPHSPRGARAPLGLLLSARSVPSLVRTTVNCRLGVRTSLRIWAPFWSLPLPASAPHSPRGQRPPCCRYLGQRCAAPSPRVHFACVPAQRSVRLPQSQWPSGCLPSVKTLPPEDARTVYFRSLRIWTVHTSLRRCGRAPFAHASSRASWSGSSPT